MKILYISNCFGIIGSSAAVRNSALVKGLAMNGHSVDVLTIKYPQERMSKFLLSCSCNNVISIDTGVTDFVQKTAGLQNKINNSFLRTIKKGLRELIFFPDIYFRWKHYVDASKFGQYDLIISSSDYKSSHFVGLKIKKMFPQIRWIQIWGDPWSLDSTLSGITHLRAKYKERYLLGNADKIVYVSELTSKSIKERFPKYRDKIFYIPRSYYKEIVAERKCPKKKYDIVYTGGLNGDRNVSGFLAQIEQYNKNHDDAFYVHFYGRYLLSVEENLRKYDFVEIHCPVDYDVVLDIYSKVDALLFVSNSASSTQIPGKLFDYFGTNLPIVCVVSGNKDLISMLRKYKQCLICEDDFSTIAEKIKGGQFTVEGQFSPEVVARRVLDIV